MKVKDLILLLQDLNQNAELFIRDDKAEVEVPLRGVISEPLDAERVYFEVEPGATRE